MKKLVVCALAAVFLLVASDGAWARETKGKVKTWEEKTRVITLDDGTQYVVTEKVKVKEKMKPGQNVKITYDEREGKNYASAVDEIEAP
jgi:maltose-binding protein MalE